MIERINSLTNEELFNELQRAKENKTKAAKMPDLKIMYDHKYLSIKQELISRGIF